jgi:hypothetical protein
MDVRLVPDQPVSDNTDFAYLDNVAFVNAERHGEAIIGLVTHIEMCHEVMLMMADTVEPVSAEIAASLRDLVGSQK